MPAPPPRHLRARSRRLSTPLHWLLSLALLTPLVAGLAGASGVASTPAAQAAPGSSAGAAVRFALAQLGKPYRWGGPKVPTASTAQGWCRPATGPPGSTCRGSHASSTGAGKLIRLSALRAGDLLFYARDTSDPRTIYHVGMYLGAGRMVEAPNRRAPVRIASIWRPGLLGKATRPADGVGGRATWGTLIANGRQRSRNRC